MSILKTIYLQHLNGANANMTLDSNGNVGIGTDSMSGKFAVSDGTVTGEINPYSASSVCFIGTRTNHPVVFQVNAAEKARIDTSGRFINGNQPSFMVYAKGGVTYGSGWQKMQFTTYGGIEFNTSSFDFTNHRYTAPVTGKYLLSSAITFSAGSNGDGTITLAKNGGTEGGRSQQWSTGGNLGGVGATYILNLASGDYVEIQLYFSGTGNTTRNTQFAGYFSGYLIG